MFANLGESNWGSLNGPNGSLNHSSLSQTSASPTIGSLSSTPPTAYTMSQTTPFSLGGPALNQQSNLSHSNHSIQSNTPHQNHMGNHDKDGNHSKNSSFLNYNSQQQKNTVFPMNTGPSFDKLSEIWSDSSPSSSSLDQGIFGGGLSLNQSPNGFGSMFGVGSINNNSSHSHSSSNHSNNGSNNSSGAFSNHSSNHSLGSNQNSQSNSIHSNHSQSNSSSHSNQSFRRSEHDVIGLLGTALPPPSHHPVVSQQRQYVETQPPLYPKRSPPKPQQIDLQQNVRNAPNTMTNNMYRVSNETLFGQKQNNNGNSSSSSSSSSDSESSYSDSDDDNDSTYDPMPDELKGGTDAPIINRSNRSLSLRASEGESKGRVLMELIESERRYLVILEKISMVADWLQQETGSMKPKDHGMIFQGSSQLLDLSKGFLGDIDSQLAGHGTDGEEDIFLEEVQIGALLKKYMPFFKIYTVYSDTYDDKQAKLDELMGDGSTDFAKYLRAAMEDKEVSGDFQSLLIQPIQRIPRYKMLIERMIQNIEKQTPDDEDLPLLKTAFQTICDVAMYVNQSLKRKEQQLKLLELQNCFFPPIVLVHPGRHLIKKGELEKIADKNNAKQKYVFFLFNDAIAYGSKLFGGYYRFHRLLSVLSFDELSMTDHQTNRFRLTTDERNLTLQAKNFEDKQHWVKAISEKMDDKHKRAATFQQGAASSALTTQSLFGKKSSPDGFDWQTSERDDSPDRETVKKKKSKSKTGVSTNTF
mmetsp:Transcript_1833/g.2401  ORF Transcript_1833/g.2401 Transcript_1833/m.2401 type:complete len:752 (-) Transcript_1833:212-2467(-)